MKLRTRILGITWFLVGIGLIVALWVAVSNRPAEDTNDTGTVFGTLFFSMFLLLVFVIPGLVFLVWSKGGYLLIALGDTVLFMGAFSFVKETPVVAYVMFALSIACYILLYTDPPWRWKRRQPNQQQVIDSE